MHPSVNQMHMMNAYVSSIYPSIKAVDKVNMLYADDFHKTRAPGIMGLKKLNIPINIYLLCPMPESTSESENIDKTYGDKHDRLKFF